MRKVLSAILIVLSLGMGPAAAQWMPAGDRQDPAAGSACTIADLAKAEVAAEVRFSAHHLDVMQVVATLTLRIPVDWPDTAKLLTGSESAAYRGTMACLFGISPEQNRDGEFRYPVKVTLRNGFTEVVYGSYANVQFDGWMAVGVAHILTMPDRKILTVIKPPLPLAKARWMETRITAGNAVLSDPVPAPPDSFAAGVVSWKPAGPPTAEMAVSMVPDTRIQFATTIGLSPWDIVYTVLGSGSAVTASLFGLWLLRRLRRGSVGVDDPRPSRIVAAMLGVVVISLLATIGRFVAPDIFDGHALRVFTVLTVSVVVWSCWWFASRCGVPGILTWPLACAVPLLVAAAYRLGQYSRVLLVTALVLLAWLLVVSLLKAASTLLCDRPWPVYVVSAAAAGLLGIEAILIDWNNATNQNWPWPAFRNGDGILGAGWPSYVGLTVDQVLGLVFVLGAASVFAAVRAYHEQGELDRLQLRDCGIGIMALAAFQPDIQVWGWGIPLGIVTVIVVWRLRGRSRSVLDMPDADGEPLRSFVSAAGVADLRARASVWNHVVQGGRALDNGLSAGTVSPEKYEHQVSVLQDEIAPRGSWFTRIRMFFQGMFFQSRRKSPGVRQQPRRLPDGVTPVDLLLSIGPHTSPLRNARTAALCSLAFGVVAVACVTWLRVDEYLLVASTQRRSVILNELVFVLVQLGKWYFAGLALGLLWQLLPGKRGPVKTLFIIVPALVLSMIEYLLSRVIIGGHWDASGPASFLLFTATLSFVGLFMDWRTLRPLREPWTKAGHAFLAAYGIRNLATQVTFILAQVAAALAILSFLVNGGDAPSYPAIDPFTLKQ